ncbi:DUF3857 domain-containing transglutaminase family protein [Candidatus Omnitrophota bacterium]
MKQALLFGERALLAIFICAGVVFAPTLIYAGAEPPAQKSADEEKVINFDEETKDESAVFLLHEISYEVKKDWSYVIKVHKKFKVLKEEAKDYGEIPIYYDKGRQKVLNLKAHTITPDGKKHKYTKAQDFKVYEGYPMYSDLMMKMVTLPQVGVGTILEHEYTVVSKGKPIEQAFWYHRGLNLSISVKSGRLSVTFPKELGIQYKEFNLEYKPKITENGSKVTYLWEKDDLILDEVTQKDDMVPPLRLEDIENYIEFSSIKSWGDISNWFYAQVQENFEITPAIERVAKKVMEGHESVKDKVRAVLEYVQEEFRYVSMSFGDNSIKPHPVKEVFRNKYGDCKDLSLFCMAMLATEGIKSYLVLFNDEYSMTDPKFDLPIPSFFDHVLLLIDDPQEGQYYVDPLLEGFDIGEFPKGVQGGYAFIIDESGGRFGRCPVFDENADYESSSKVIAIDPVDGSAVIETESGWDLEQSISTRDMVKAMTGEEKELFFEILKQRLAAGGEVEYSRINGLDEKYGRLTSESKVKRPDLYPVTDDMIIIELDSLSRAPWFHKEDREKPIFFPFNSLDERKLTYIIPDGFRVSHMPKSVDLDIGGFQFKREIERKDNKVTITDIRRYRRVEFPKEQYPKVKAYFDKLPGRTNQRIVFKRIKLLQDEVRDFIGNLKSKFSKEE